MTKEPVKYFVACFESVSHVMYAERILKETHVLHKLIPIPRAISSNCGICIRFLPEHREIFENTLAGKVEGFEIRKL
jgi:hypothetical protein